MYKEESIPEYIRTIIVAGTIAFMVLACIIILILFFYSKRKNALLFEREELKNQFNQTLLQSQLEIQEQTLNKISQEIHDNIGQVLSLAKLNVTTIDICQPEKARVKIADSRELLTKAIQDLRNLA